MDTVENKEVFARNLQHYIDLHKKNAVEICEDLGLKTSTVSDWLTAKKYPRIDKIEKLANYFMVPKSALIEENGASLSNAIRVPVFGTVPAGIPVEAVEDVLDYEEIPREMAAGGREYFGLRVKGDSMEPEYRDGDTILVARQGACESGQVAVVYVNGHDATLKRVVKREDSVVLQPLNHNYDPMVYRLDDAANPVVVLGVVVEIRRKVQ